MTEQRQLQCTAVLPPGLEEAGASELSELGASAVKPLRRAVAFRTDLAGFYRLQLQARLPFRLLRQLAVFPCRSREELYAGVQRATDWEQWLPPELSFRVDASGSLPGLNHSHYSALQVKNALVDWQRQHFGQRSSVDLDDPDLHLHVHLGGGQAQLSVDGSGESLHRRGYRPRMGLAPLKENLAAGLIRLTGWDGHVPLADPLCGSGTLLIEAACIALGRAAGLEHRFALERWPDFNGRLWNQALEQAASSERSQLADGTSLAPVIGLERDAGVAEQARANAEAAGVGGAVTIHCADFRSFEPPAGPGVLVCNPPYGERIGEADELEQLYADLGRMVKERCSGWEFWLLSGNPELTGALRMKASRRIPVSNGGIDCRWLHYSIR
jgi:putative N6-adenine-specific DNA methylase